MKRITFTAALAALLVLGVAAPASAFLENLAGIGARGQSPTGALASGRIIGGGRGTSYFFLYMYNNYSDAGDPARCAQAYDCSQWRASGCKDEKYVRRDPAITTSIVDVRPLGGDGKTHVVGLTAREGWDQYGVAVQFWDTGCAEVVVPWVSPSHHESVRVDASHPAYFQVPAEAAWMTVVGVQAIDVEWGLR